MKIRSQTELQDYLDRTLALRKRELTTLRFIIMQTNREHEKVALLRSSLPMLYAHWEGFIKDSSIAYLEYISRQRLALNTLKPNFVAVTLKEKLMTAGISKKTRIHKEFVDYFLDNFETNVAFNPVSVIDTESNLSSEVLKEIMFTVGLDFDDNWHKKTQLIDHQLLKSRNEIAHGEPVTIDLALFEQLHKFVLDSLEEYKTLIENSVALSSYKKLQA